MAKATRTVQEVLEERKAEGFILLDEKINKRVDVYNFRCPKGHEYSTSFRNFSRGKGCPACRNKSGEVSEFRKRGITEEDVKVFLEEHEYEMLDTYKDYTTKMSIRCTRGHITEKSFHNLRTMSHKCKHCTKEINEEERIRKKEQDKLEQRLRKTEEINNKLKDNKDGVILISTYTALKDKHTFTCKEGHVFTRALERVYKSNFRCMECFKSKPREISSLKYTHDYVKQEVEKAGYTFIDLVGEGSDSKIKLSCSNEIHPETETITGEFFRKDKPQRCKYCNSTISPLLIEKIIKEENYAWLNRDSMNIDNQMKVKCDKGHIFNTNFSKLNKGTRCRTCRQSRTEFMIHQALIYLYGSDKVYYEYPLQLEGRNLRIDFFINTGKGIYIEYDGGSHHKENKFGKSDEEFQMYLDRDKIKDNYFDSINSKTMRIDDSFVGSTAMVEMLKRLDKKLPYEVYMDIVKEGMDRPSLMDKNPTPFHVHKEIADRLLYKRDGETVADICYDYGVRKNIPHKYVRKVYGINLSDMRRGGMSDFIEDNIPV